MTTLFVAAGGGGDAVGILLARRVLDPNTDGPALVTTCAWERLRIDPTPGPRSISGFTGLGDVNGLPVEILANTDTGPRGRSILPRLSAEADARIFLHDFDCGARGLADQLRRLVSALDADRLVVVDVGGDVVAIGDEPTLLSPLADSLTLAGALLSEVPTTLAVIGPGVDAELSEQDVIQRLSAAGARVAGHVAEHDVQRGGSVLDWHPTEASALVAASAIGERGSVDMRRGSVPTPLTARGCQVWLAGTPKFDNFCLARSLSPSAGLQEAITIIERISVNEIAYERGKAEKSYASTQPSVAVPQVVEEAMLAGATHITTRRLIERANLDSSSAERTIRELKSVTPGAGPLWRLSALRLASR